MAKQLVNPIERHIEKVVLGVAVLVFLGAAAKFLVTSPNKVDLDMEMVSPSEIEGKLIQKANTVRSAVANKRTEIEIPEPLYGELLRQLDPWSAGILPREMPVTVAIGPEVPIIERVASTKTRTLLEVVKPESLRTTQGRTLFEVDAPEESVSDTMNVLMDWVTISTVLDRKKQAELQTQMYGNRQRVILYGPMDVQRRPQRRDGTWSDADWVDVTPWPDTRPKDIPTVRLVEQDGQTVTTAETRNTLNRYRSEVSDPARQLNMLRPILPPWTVGDAWRFPIFTTLIDVQEMDTEFMRGAGDGLVCRYPECEGVLVTDAVEVDFAELIEAEFAKADAYLAQAVRTWDVNDVYRGRNIYFDAKHGQGIFKNATAADKRRAEEGLARADELELKILRNPRAATAVEDTGTGGEESAAMMEYLDRQQLWQVDAQRDAKRVAQPNKGLKPGHAYQYRVRFWIFNQQVGSPASFKNAQDATVVFVQGPWSDPCDPVLIEPYTYCFVTDSGTPADEDVKLELFQWSDGVWVADKFEFTIGDVVLDESRVWIPHPDGSGVPVKAPVAFGDRLGLSIADIDYTTKLRGRSRPSRSNKEGILFKDSFGPQAQLSVVFMDEDGVLHERFSEADSTDSKWEEVKGRVYKKKR